MGEGKVLVSRALQQRDYQCITHHQRHGGARGRSQVRAGQASDSTLASRCTSEVCASVDCALPVMLISATPMRFISGNSVTTSAVEPELIEQPLHHVW